MTKKNNSSNNFCDLSNLNVNNINLSKDVINQIDCPPFIPSNYPKRKTINSQEKNQKILYQKTKKAIPLQQFRIKKKMKFRMNK